MKTVGRLCLSLVFTAGMFAQNRAGFVNPGPYTVRSFPSVVFPGGSSAFPGVQRTVGSVVYPAGGLPQIGVPGIRLNGAVTSNNGSNFNNGFGFNNGWGNGWGKSSAGRRNNGVNNGGVVTTFAYPVAVPVPVYGGDPYYDPSAAAAAAPPQQPNVIVIYPPAPSSAQPAMMLPPQQPLETGPQPTATSDTGDTATHYLIAFKDHSIYSAVAYWVEGDTLHYFTSGNTHNQVSLSLVDRELTKQLNEQAGLQMNLPPAK